MNEETGENKYMSALPFPQKQSREKLDKQFGRFLEVLKQEILPKKRKVEETSVAKLIEHCSAILQNKLPKKCSDPRSFTIPCSLGSEVFVKLEVEIGEIRSIPVSLQLADHTAIIPEGIVEDVLVRADKFVFHVNFIVVNMEENREVPLILGRSFLSTGRAILDIQERQLMLRVGEERLIFKMEGGGRGKGETWRESNE
ncbi:PREDICTED: uncharacterized protein LOC109210607 [Nicotiana attenuata]|uniref:uncharacterized protein LOC109210607 n=1 Tax=Nicotiana attenuata TaxID=49451 RepID=UPI0009051821|nr:PREDICTED: uncharacterized protein LOC109210607 [Nicotiana attenuata]